MINLKKQTEASIYESINFIKKCRVEGSWKFLPHLGAKKPTLYSSAFAAMSFFYTKELNKLSNSDRQAWGHFLGQHQSATDGLYESEEILDSPGVMHNLEHRKLHLTCHLLPVMSILGVAPFHRIRYIDKYKDITELKKWLNQVDLSQSWIEGNNLLFMGQLLWFEYTNFNDKKAKTSLDYLMSWLNTNVDPETGLWGTDSGCSLHQSMFGSYHQLILYFFQKIEPPHINKLIDSTLQCQHFDGGFNSGLGGGTCQDIDGIDILVKATQITEYRSNAIELSLKRAIVHLLRDRQAENGGFIDSPGQKFIHNSMPATRTEPEVANTFSTWFTLHALANIAPILRIDLGLQYNDTLSMGWGEKKAGKKNKTSIESFILTCRSVYNIVLTKSVLFIYKRVKPYINK
ncbi:MAG: hypothetical protein ACI9YH_000397 [Colwellia sp.]|jgi:hypothetical protein